eukprot:Sspe_Gene.76683::Locus_47918_Transcript_1_1_Confidence_1.000_Length_1362::g.76683::m.76683/K11426/SMYD; SET and MYND domain-containing protein
MSFAELLAQQQAIPTNEGEGVIPKQSIPPVYPRVPPGFIGAEYSDSGRTDPPACQMHTSPELGTHLIATRDIEVGECILEDEAVLQVPWDTDFYLHSAAHGLFQKAIVEFGRGSLDQGYIQLVARFLMTAKHFQRRTGAMLWDIVSSWWCPVKEVGEEGYRQTEQIAQAIHDCIPSPFEGLLTVEDIIRLILVWDVNSLTCHVGRGHTAVYPFARHAEHSCYANATFLFLDYPEDEWPSRVQYRAMRKISKGDHISISYIPGYQRTSDRQARLKKQYFFDCKCEGCTTLPDLARGFKCWLCDRNEGVISPVGLGEKGEDWRCLQCGVMLEAHRIEDCLEAERKLMRVKADKWKGLSQLMGDEVMHFTHYLCFRKLDQWAQRSWQEKDGLTTANMVEAMLKCAERVFQKYDPAKAQFHEFIAQVRHGMGEA